jgi:hypothetical protein
MLMIKLVRHLVEIGLKAKSKCKVTGRATPGCSSASSQRFCSPSGSPCGFSIIERSRTRAEGEEIARWQKTIASHRVDQTATKKAGQRRVVVSIVTRAWPIPMFGSSSQMMLSRCFVSRQAAGSIAVIDRSRFGDASPHCRKRVLHVSYKWGSNQWD